jgi:hypothetical protein
MMRRLHAVCFPLSPVFGGEGGVRGRRHKANAGVCRSAPSSGADAPPSPPKTGEKGTKEFG